MKTKPFSHVPGSETMTSPVITPGCWCQGRAEVRPGSQLTAQGPCLHKLRWGPGLISAKGSSHGQEVSHSLPAGCLGTSAEASARLFRQRHHCTISKLALSPSSQIYQRRAWALGQSNYSQRPQADAFSMGPMGVVMSCWHSLSTPGVGC